MKYPVPKQAQILGSLLFPEVSKKIEEFKFEQRKAPKIVGMMIDFEIFEV